MLTRVFQEVLEDIESDNNVHRTRKVKTDFGIIFSTIEPVKRK